MRFRLPRHRLRFSLSTLFIVLTLFCVWLARNVEQARRQQTAVARLKASGATVRYFAQSPKLRWAPPDRPPFGPKWLRDLLGDDFFNTVATVKFRGGAHVKDEDLRPLVDLLHLRELYLGGADRQELAQLTDEGLQHLEGLSALQLLDIAEDSQITPHGLRHLAHLTQLKQLTLFDAQMSDAWLEPIQFLENLEEFGAWAPYGSSISDAGLEHLSSLHKLRMLYIQSSRVTDTGVQSFNERLPDCKVYR
jgi:hypothetical protein